MAEQVTRNPVIELSLEASWIEHQPKSRILALPKLGDERPVRIQADDEKPQLPQVGQTWILIELVDQVERGLFPRQPLGDADRFDPQVVDGNDSDGPFKQLIRVAHWLRLVVLRLTRGQRMP